MLEDVTDNDADTLGLNVADTDELALGEELDEPDTEPV